MISENKISKFIALLISETKNGSVTWETSSTRNLDSLEDQQTIIGKVYITEFKQRDIRLYKYSEPIQVDEFDYIPRSFIKLEFIDENERNLWSFPFFIRELIDLYETVQIKSSNLDKFFDENFPDDSIEF